MRIIMAIDIIDGKCVRLTRGDYGENPLDVASEFEDYGIKYLHLVDLDGAKNKKVINHKILEKISSATNLQIDFAGGIRSDEDLRIAFNSGVRQVTAGSIAVNQPVLFLEWVNRYGSDRIILGADFLDRKVVSGAWKEISEKDIVTFISEYANEGLRYTICTDVEKDGMMEGPSMEIYKEILQSADINLIASGGVSSLKDIQELMDAGCEGVITGKAVYEGRIKLKELSRLC
jgi:phosphoribosylformimino-5-aminoimidazole carboxamide ribotide isomerase